MTLVQNVLSSALRASAAVRYGGRYDAPVRPDRIHWVDPSEIRRKPAAKPPSDTVPPTLVAGGEWDLDLENVSDDVVYETFHRRFVDGEEWDETGYVDFLSTNVSEYGGRTPDEARERCEKMDELYRYIEEHGYKSQRELQAEGGFVDGLTDGFRPPAYREVAVDVTRDGEFVWHAGMHRLVIAQLVGVDEIPVRIHTRHEKWQEIRDAMYNGTEKERFVDHPDVRYLI